MSKEKVIHPDYYGGKDNPYEVIKVLEAWEKSNANLNWKLLTVVKYLARCGLKDNNNLLQELKKAKFYLDREISNLEEEEARNSSKKKERYPGENLEVVLLSDRDTCEGC